MGGGRAASRWDWKREAAEGPVVVLIEVAFKVIDPELTPPREDSRGGEGTMAREGCGPEAADFTMMKRGGGAAME